MRAVRYYSILFYSWMLSFASVLWPIKFIIGKGYCESAARILFRTCAVMLRTRTVIMADKFCPYFGDFFWLFLFGNGTFYYSFGKECIKWLILDKTRTRKRHDSRFLSFFQASIGNTSARTMGSGSFRPMTISAYNFFKIKSHTRKFYFIPANFIHRGYKNPQFEIWVGTLA